MYSFSSSLMCWAFLWCWERDWSLRLRDGISPFTLSCFLQKKLRSTAFLEKWLEEAAEHDGKKNSILQTCSLPVVLDRRFSNSHGPNAISSRECRRGASLATKSRPQHFLHQNNHTGHLLTHLFFLSEKWFQNAEFCQMIGAKKTLVCCGFTPRITSLRSCGSNNQHEICSFTHQHQCNQSVHGGIHWCQGAQKHQIDAWMFTAWHCWGGPTTCSSPRRPKVWQKF